MAGRGRRRRLLFAIQVPVILGGFNWEGEIPGNGPLSLIVQAEGSGARSIRVERAEG